MSDQFSINQIRKLKAQFDKFDVDDDKTIATKELGQIMKSLGQRLTEHQLEKLIKQIDSDGSGTIQFQEFLCLLGRKMKNVESNQELREVFDQFDKDGDGNISPLDLKKAFKDMHKDMKPQQINQMIDEMLRYVDIDEDGMINFQQFVTIMMAM